MSLGWPGRFDFTFARGFRKNGGRSNGDGEFEVAAEGVGELHLARSFALGLEEFGAGDEDNDGFCA